jgi:hypothetical protein
MNTIPILNQIDQDAELLENVNDVPEVIEMSEQEFINYLTQRKDA